MILVARRNRRQQPLERKLQILRRPAPSTSSRIRRRRIHLVHGVGRNRQQQFIALCRETSRTARESPHRRHWSAAPARAASPRCCGAIALHGLALRIPRQLPAAKCAPAPPAPSANSQGVLVEVQAQRVAATQRRMILLHRLHARARSRRHTVRLMHGSSSSSTSEARSNRRRAWPRSPSASASSAAAGPSAPHSFRACTPAQSSSFTKSIHAQAAAHARHPASGQRMVGPGNIIPHRLRGPAAQQKPIPHSSPSPDPPSNPP